MVIDEKNRLEITRICDILRGELYENGYRYGFCLNGRKVVPDTSKGYDADFGRLLGEQYLIQAPETTRKEKVATCLDAVMVMRELLSGNGISSRIWMVFQKEKRKPHSVLSFVIGGVLVYLELTPQSGKKNYAKELLFESESEFIRYWEDMGYTVHEITDVCLPGRKPYFFLDLLKQS